MGTTMNITYTSPDGAEKAAWTSLGNDSYSLELWKREETDPVWAKFLELRLTYYLDSTSDTQVEGTVVTNVHSDWDTAPQGQKHPDWVRIDFDSNRNGAGWMRVSIQGYRNFPDIGSGNTQNTVIELTKDADGAVSVVSTARVPGSRHLWVFVLANQNGSDQEVLNTASSTPETRYYIFAGRGNAQNRASVSLALAKDGYTESTVFSDYSIGRVIGRLFADRLINDYDFDGDSDTDIDEGRKNPFEAERDKRRKRLRSAGHGHLLEQHTGGDSLCARERSGSPRTLAGGFHHRLPGDHDERGKSRVLPGGLLSVLGCAGAGGLSIRGGGRRSRSDTAEHGRLARSRLPDTRERFRSGLLSASPRPSCGRATEESSPVRVVKRFHA